MIKAMGGSPTPIAWGELYSALAQGTVDGAENNPPSFTSNKHYEICKHFTLDGHTRIPDMLLMSSEFEKTRPTGAGMGTTGRHGVSRFSAKTLAGKYHRVIGAG